MSTTIYKKLLEVKKKVPYLKKDKKGYNYSYTTPSSILATINPLLNDLGLLLLTAVVESKSYEITITTKSGPKTEWKYDVDFIFTWVDCDNGERLDIPFKASGVNGEDKGLGSALTYAERYFLLKQFNIPTDDDDPDNFQEKHMPDEEKKQKENGKIGAAIAELYLAQTLPTLQSVWMKYKPLQTNPAFIAAKDAHKTALSTSKEELHHSANEVEASQQ